MGDFLIQHDAEIRTYLLVGGAFFVALWESFQPARKLNQPTLKRWGQNLLLFIFNGILLKWLFPLFGIGWAVYVADADWGLLNSFEAPMWTIVLPSLLLLDFSVYLQHYALHHIPWLWRLHQVHHADLDYDFSTGLRFHPLEAIVAIVTRLLVTLALGIPPVLVAIHEAMIIANALFSHANVQLPEVIDRPLRRLLVTPNMHRIHHSIEIDESNSNFGSVLPFWDRLFGTYIEEPRASVADMSIGLEQFRDGKKLTLVRLLIMPFSAPAPDNPTNPSPQDS